MNNLKKNKLVKIYWNDAIIYGKSSDLKLNLQKKITEGELVKESKDFLIIKDPITVNYDIDLKRYVPFVKKRKITFFFIPTGMINKKELIG